MSGDEIGELLHAVEVERDEALAEVEDVCERNRALYRERDEARVEVEWLKARVARHDREHEALREAYCRVLDENVEGSAGEGESPAAHQFHAKPDAPLRFRLLAYLHELRETATARWYGKEGDTAASEIANELEALLDG